MPKKAATVDAVRWGGPLPGAMRLPMIDGELPPHVDVVTGETVARYKRTTEADHWPMDRRTLVLRGEDPSHPKWGRGLCKPCHAVETAHLQPGGWNRG